MHKCPSEALVDPSAHLVITLQGRYGFRTRIACRRAGLTASSVHFQKSQFLGTGSLLQRRALSSSATQRDWNRRPRVVQHREVREFQLHDPRCSGKLYCDSSLQRSVLWPVELWQRGQWWSRFRCVSQRCSSVEEFRHIQGGRRREPRLEERVSRPPSKCPRKTRLYISTHSQLPLR